MEFLNLATKYSFHNDGSVLINASLITRQDVLYSWLGFPLAMILLAVGLVVNILLIIATLRSPRLKAPIFQLLFAIAFADLILLVSYSLPAITDKSNNKMWMLGSQGCRILVFLQFLPTHVTSCLILVCCWERFYAVCRPHSALWITTQKTSGVIAITWLLNAGQCYGSFIGMQGPRLFTICCSCHVRAASFICIRKLLFSLMLLKCHRG